MPIKRNKPLLAVILLILVFIASASVSALALTSTTSALSTVVSQVGASADDAEESLNSGNVTTTSPDLQLGAANNTNQLVGIRFTNITIPRNAVIMSAHVEFEVGATGSTSTSVTIQGQAIDNAPAFTSAKHNISARLRTTAQVACSNIPAWPVLNAKWQTPNISAIIQEVVNRPKWANGNSIVILINGSGQRTAKSYDGNPAAAPRLIINFMIPTSPVTLTTTDTPAPVGTPTPFPPGSTHFAVIGDYGTAGQPELDVANLVKSWNPDFIMTTGDNNYPDGAASTIDANIGQYYQEFIYPYIGSYGPGAATNRFFPTLGNHDWYTTNAQPYLNYFSLPGNERYYDLVWGSIHLFVIDSDPSEPDGNSSVSTQAQWLQAQLAASTSPWNFVFMHHPPYSSGSVHGSTPVMQWPYQLWGASAVVAGHDHLYERIFHDGIPYFVNGLGGTSKYGIGTPVAGSQIRYDGDYGAMAVIATDSQITFQFIARTGAVIDTYTLNKPSMFPQISGDVGVTGTILSYTDGTAKTVISQANGSYAIQIPMGWSGTVTPSNACYTFNPANRNYSNVTTNQTTQDYIATFNPASGCTNIDITIGGTTQGLFGIPPHNSTLASFAEVNDGPVKIASTNGTSLIGAERVIYKVNGSNTSFSEMLALPNSQLDSTYWLPWYNNVDLDTQLRLGNVSNSPATVHIFIGGSEVTPLSGVTLAVGASTRMSYGGVNNGPVQIVSDHNILVAERVVYNVDPDTQLRLGDVRNSPATVHIFIGGSEVTPLSGVTLAVGASTRMSYGGVNNGPVQIVSDQNIVAAERVIYKVNGSNTSFSEMLALPNSQLDTTYWLPWYNNVDLDTQLRFAMP